jgi:Helix-turn-helix domain
VKSSERLWLSVAALAARYGLSIATVRHWLKIGRLNASNGAHWIGNSWRINVVEFETSL